jgi:hypothetical protein
MADTDNSSYLVRYNLVSQTPEFFVGSDWYAQHSSNTFGLADGKMLVGDSGGVATARTLSGGLSVSNTGVVTLTNSSVIGAVLTGYTSGAGTVASTDTILQGINKLNGNTALKATAGAVGSSGLTQNTARLLGRTTSSAGAIEEITVGSGLTLSAGSLTASAAAQVLPQVVFAVGTTQYSNTSATYVGVGPTASITLQKSTNKVKVTVTGALGFDTVNGRAAVTIKRDSTDLDTSTHGLTYLENLQANAAIVVPCSLTYVDAPGDTSSHTYQAFAKYVVVSTGVIWGAENTQTTITLEEILS